MPSASLKCCGRAAIAAAVLLTGFSSSAFASNPPIVEYSFPISWNGSGVVSDLSAAGNNAVIQGTASVSTTIPAGTTGKSILTNAGGPITNYASEFALLTNAYVASYGGFSYDTWFRWDGTANASWNTQKIIDYSGTESLQLYNAAGVGQTANEQVQFAFNSSTTTANAISFSISPNVWYHAIATFSSGSNTVGSDGSLAGVASFSLGTGSTFTTTTLNVTKTNQGDALVRPIAIGNLGLANSSALVEFDGLIYNPTVSLGVEPLPAIATLDGPPSIGVPEPATLALSSLAAPLLLRRKRHS
ncbi:MAG TPA: hypothetical protein VFE58_08025 [Tepidisphaeraceae bacterium]|jgi:hypothetical protein|nr:hypothetical protein [Tepidisphaeraceae bacterium]